MAESINVGAGDYNLSQEDDDQSCWEMSKAVFARDWLRPEEDEAWAHLQETDPA